MFNSKKPDVEKDVKDKNINKKEEIKGTYHLLLKAIKNPNAPFKLNSPAVDASDANKKHEDKTADVVDTVKLRPKKSK